MQMGKREACFRSTNVTDIAKQRKMKVCWESSMERKAKCQVEAEKGPVVEKSEQCRDCIENH